MTTERADREVLKVSRLEIGELVGRIGYEGCWAKWTTLQPINGERVRDVVPLLHPGDIVASRDERSLGTSRLLCFIVHQTEVRRFALLWQGGEFSSCLALWEKERIVSFLQRGGRRGQPNGAHRGAGCSVSSQQKASGFKVRRAGQTAAPSERPTQKSSQSTRPIPIYGTQRQETHIRIRPSSRVHCMQFRWLYYRMCIFSPARIDSLHRLCQRLQSCGASRLRLQPLLPRDVE